VFVVFQRCYDEVFKAVVMSDAIQMMNDLSAGQLPIEMRLHEESVLRLISLSDSHPDISIVPLVTTSDPTMVCGAETRSGFGWTNCYPDSPQCTTHGRSADTSGLSDLIAIHPALVESNGFTKRDFCMPLPFRAARNAGHLQPMSHGRLSESDKRRDFIGCFSRRIQSDDFVGRDVWFLEFSGSLLASKAFHGPNYISKHGQTALIGSMN
jgi:hypothetical protein